LHPSARSAIVGAAKDLLAGVYEKIGHQKESPGVRNSFLAAYELRSDIPPGGTAAAEPERSAHR